MQTDYPPSVRLYFRSGQWLDKFPTLVKAIWVGIWLGILDRKSLHAIDQYCYQMWAEYRTSEHNLRGLNNWEHLILDKYFPSHSRLLLAGAGGGREVIALSKMGYHVDGFECHAGLCKFANELIEKEQLAAHVALVARDECPVSNDVYDGLIVGWGAYMLIQGRDRRIAFLQKMRANVSIDAPILISFYARNLTQRRFRVIMATGNILRRLLNRPLLELGDGLAPNFVHYFSREEVSAELKEAGFTLTYFDDAEYGHAVGFAH